MKQSAISKQRSDLIKPRLIGARANASRSIRVSREYLLSLKLTNAEHLELEKACLRQWDNPAELWYPDNPRMRALLKV